MAKINRVYLSDLSLCPDIEPVLTANGEPVDLQGPGQGRSTAGGGRHRGSQTCFPPAHPCWRAGGTHKKKLLPKTASAEPSQRHPEEALEEAVCPEATRLYT